MTATIPDTPAAAACVRSIHAIASGSRSELDEVVASRAVNREAMAEPAACRRPGPDGFAATAQWLRAAYDDLSFDVHDVAVDGELVVVHATMRGRQTGTFLTYDEGGHVADAFPATGRSFATTQTHWFRTADGLVTEHWANRDDLGQARQLGWIPPSPRYLVRMARARRRARRTAAA